MDIRLISAEETLPIRHAVLWPTKSINFCRVSNDDKGLHYGAYRHGELVSVASIFTSGKVSRLRKFATRSEFQGQGIGKAMLTRIMSDLKASGVEHFWCDARISATGIYTKFGLQPEGECFYKGDVAYTKMAVSWLGKPHKSTCS